MSALPDCHTSIRTELWTVAQDNTALHLLRAFRPPLLPQVFDLSSITWAGGSILRHRPSDLAGYTRWLNQNRFNESLVRFNFKSRPCLDSDLSLTALEFRVRVSPTSSSWESAYGNEGASDDAEHARMFHESLERVLKWNAVKTCPSVLEASFTFSGKAVKEKFYPHFVGLLAKGLALKPPPDYLGCGYLITDGELGFFERQAPWPKTFPEFESKFDSLHPIMIGPVALCEKLRESITSVGWDVSVWRTEGNYGLLWIPDNVISNKSVTKACSRFLVERSENTRSRRIDQSTESGDFRFGPALFHTFRRYEQLAVQGLLPSSDDRHTYFPLVSPEYCRIIDVDPGSMLVTAAPTNWVQEVQSEINKFVGALSGADSDREKIYAAHEKVYRERYESIPGLFVQLWEYMKATYFTWKT
jgi:hypothetical protein